MKYQTFYNYSEFDRRNKSEMSSCRGFLSLLWKNWLFHKHHFIVTFFEIAFPLLLCFLLAYNANNLSADKTKRNNATFYNSYVVTQVDNEHVKGELLFTPENKFTQNLIHTAFANYNLEIRGVDSENDIETAAMRRNKSSPEIRGIVFSGVEDEKKFPTSLKYKLRLSPDNNFKTQYTDYRSPQNGPRVSESNRILKTAYITSGFLNMQTQIDLAYIKLYQEEIPNQHRNDYQVVITAQPMPYPSYTKVEVTVFNYLPYIIILGLIITYPMIIRRIVEEKAVRAKEMMKMMGMSTFTYWGSVFISNFLLAVVISTLTVVLFIIEFSDGVSILGQSSGILFFVILLLYNAAALLFCFTISIFLNKASLAIVATIILWICSFAVPDLILGSSTQFYFEDTSMFVKLTTSLMPNMALLWSIKIISIFNSLGTGAQWNNLFEAPYDDGFSLGVILVLLTLSCVMYSILIWYLDAVWPWQPGVPKSPYFCFLPSYWLNRPPQKTDFIDMKTHSPYFEEEPATTSPSVILSHLTKIFTVGSIKKTAVNNVSLNMYPGQITALLGHNGAGKTTVMNMLTGIFPPDQGTALINGHDVLKNTAAARKSLGLCPQHNVLYDILTVEQHLKFFGGIKGMTWSKLNAEITKILTLLQLKDKRHTLAKNLSGGMKRKLSLGISLIGGSEVLILDEPTSGLDPEARRVIWDALQEFRHGRTILLTTHYMEEADVLGDRIAIMANGSIKCCGSPIFLKGKFGTGYHLHIAKREFCNESEITRIIRHHIPEAKLISNINLEMTYSLSNTSRGYGVLFETLEKFYSTLGIASCGVTITTMEDVFLKVGHMAEPEGEKMLPMNNNDTKTCVEPASNKDTKLSCACKLTGSKLLVQQMKSLFMKRLHYAKRHWIMLIYQFIIPVAVFCLLCWTDSTLKSESGQREKDLNLSLHELYGNANGFYYVKQSNEIINSLKNNYKDLLKHENATIINIPSDNDIQQFFLQRGENNVNSYVQNDLVAAHMVQNTETKKTVQLTSWFNSAPYHVDPISINLMTTTFLKHVTGNKNFSIHAVNYPLPQSLEKHKSLNAAVIYLLYSLFIPLGLTFLSSSFVMFPVHERVSKAKLLQRMCGISGVTLWIINLLWDYLIHMLCSIVIMIPVFIYALATSNIDTEAVGAMLFIIMMYGFASIPFTYLISFIPEVPSSGFSVLTTLNTIFGMIVVMILAVLQESTLVPAKKLNTAKWILRIFPSFSVTWGMSKIRIVSEENSYHEQNKIHIGNQYEQKKFITWDDSTAGRESFVLAISGFVYFTILILMESVLPKLWYRLTALFSKSKNKTSTGTKYNQFVNINEDVDVANESNRAQQLFQTGQTKKEAIVALNLTKYFSSFCAVDNLSFAVHKKDCFGLLGVNGAGKTTTFRMLAGDLMPTNGNAYIGEYGIKQKQQKFQENIGYCPQFDALFDRLTGREMLILFASLRGVLPRDINFVVSRMITLCDLDKHADKTTETYSGGTKRKLSLGLALIGAPPVVLLDEPTAGVDPASRRKIWETLTKMKQLLGLSFILTSHGMDECEALCNQIAIMVNGQFRCFGSLQHLKSKFGQGFTLVAKVNQGSDVVKQVRTYIEAAFPSAVLKDAHQGILQYHVTDVTEKWSRMFAVMEQTKAHFHLEDYLVSDTTLEQIFLAFARTQVQSDEL